MRKLLKFLGIAIVTGVVVLGFSTSNIGAIAEMYGDGDERVRTNEPIGGEDGYESIVPLSSEHYESIMPVVDGEEFEEIEPISTTTDNEDNNGVNWEIVAVSAGGAVLLAVIGILIIKSVNKKK